LRPGFGYLLQNWGLLINSQRWTVILDATTIGLKRMLNNGSEDNFANSSPRSNFTNSDIQDNYVKTAFEVL
jgi:hypothetical protein